jgi:hypothetical protein
MSDAFYVNCMTVRMRDEQLQSWRWPFDPDFIVRADTIFPPLVRVLHEPSWAIFVFRGPDDEPALLSTRTRMAWSAASDYYRVIATTGETDG